jgi:hypothetical protein
MPSAAAVIASISADGSEDSSTGTPAALAAATAVALLPAISSTAADGPMKVMPTSAQACARPGFSERKP